MPGIGLAAEGPVPQLLSRPGIATRCEATGMAQQIFVDLLAGYDEQHLPLREHYVNA